MSESNFDATGMAAQVTKPKPKFYKCYTPNNIRAPFAKDGKHYIELIENGAITTLECTPEIHMMGISKKITRKAFEHVTLVYTKQEEDGSEVVFRLDVSTIPYDEPLNRAGKILARFDKETGFAALTVDDYGMRRRDNIQLNTQLCDATELKEGDKFLSVYGVKLIKDISNRVGEIELEFMPENIPMGNSIKI